jgi:chitin disaccharide deacetylase
MKINIHADDLGATPSVDDSILSAFKKGSIDSASVLANGESLHVTANKVRKPNNPLKIRIHLNLSEGKPVSDPQKIPLLVNKNGQFHYGFCNLLNTINCTTSTKRNALRQMIKIEFTKQIEQVLNIFGREVVCGVDSHIHIHMIPFIFEIAAEVCAENGLNEIRVTREIPHYSQSDGINKNLLINVTKHLLLNYLATKVLLIQQKYKLQSPDFVAGVLYSGIMSFTSAQAAVNAAKRKHCKWLELMFHPGLAEKHELPRWQGQEKIAAFYMSNQRIKEQRALFDIGSYRFSE